MLLALAVLLWPGNARAQELPPARIDVFLETDPATGLSRLFFLDPLSGLSAVVNADRGRDFRLVGRYVIYEKTRTGAIMRANADGTLEPHPFIRRGIDTESVWWVVSPDGGAIAWVQVSTAGVSSAYAALADGRDLRQLPISTPGAGLELMPLALTNGMGRFFYDSAHPRGGAATPFVNYDYLALYSIADEAFYALPQEPRCVCGAAASADGRIFARLETLSGDGGPFALRIWDLPTGTDIYVPPPETSYRTAGDLLLNRNVTLAAYSVAADAGSDADLATDAYGLVVVDLVGRRQVLAFEPGTTRYQPLAFIDGDSELLLAADDGTYKLDLGTRDLLRVSDKIYLGTIGD
jgi:hypothetical protein